MAAHVAGDDLQIVAKMETQVFWQHRPPGILYNHLFRTSF